jgi:hypothetical protein
VSEANPDRGALLAGLAQTLAAAAGSVSGDWDGYSVVAEVTPLGLRATGYRYVGDALPMPMLMDSGVLEAIDRLRRASPGPNGELFDIYVARLDRASGSIVDQAFTAQTGTEYRVTAANVTRIGALVRPGLPFLPSSAAPVPGPPLPASAGPAPVSVSEPPSEVESTPSTASLEATVANAVRAWRELSVPDWDGFGGAVAFTENAAVSIGFRYTKSGAVPTIVGGSYLTDVRTLAASAPDENGLRPGAVLVRLPGRTADPQIRIVYPPAASQITWTEVDESLATRLRPTADSPGYLAPRRPGDLLDVTSLLDRIKADVAASLRGRDEWRSFALGVDVSRNRAVAYVYTDDGTPLRYHPPLSPLADLAELRAQTARPDGSQWAGAILHSWRSSGDRVDVVCYGDAGINDYLGQGPDVAGMLMRPDAEPPNDPGPPPWPATGGYLDTQALIDQVSAASLGSADLRGPDWDRLAVVIAFADTTPTVSAVRYSGLGPAVVTRIEDAGPIGKLRRSNPNDVGWLWDACLLRGIRGSPRLSAEFRFSRDADDFRVGPDTILRVADRLRPI